MTRRAEFLVFWGMALVLFMGLLAMIFDFGRMATTQSELQSFADTVSLTAAAELDGTSDALTRASDAAQALISDTQTFAMGARALTAANDVQMTYYRPDAAGKFTRSPALVTTSPFQARFVDVRVAERTVSAGLGAAFAALRGTEARGAAVSAQAAAGFSLEACNVAPVAVCLPQIDFDAKANIGKTLSLRTAVTVNNLVPGNIVPIDTVTDALDGLQVCAGLSLGALDACLIAARKPETACTGQGGLTISADVTAANLLDSINTRLGLYNGVSQGLSGQSNFAAAPNILAGLTTIAGLCLPVPNLLATSDISLPKDDCLTAGTCTGQGNGVWTNGRKAYVNAHYGGKDPHVSAVTRFDYYKAEVAASAAPIKPFTGLLTGFVPKLCAPPTPATSDRRLMVVAGIDCLSASVNGAVTTPPVQAYLEVFVLGPGKNGTLDVEVTACLGGSCGKGALGTDVHDVVRLVE